LARRRFCQQAGLCGKEAADEAKAMVRILKIDDEGRWLNAAVADLAAGKPVAMPTETVYGLAADATDGRAVAGIFALKGRPSFNPLICHVDGMAMAENLGTFDATARKLATAFWPGPLTLVVPRTRDCPVHDLATAGLDTIGIRMPAGKAAALIAAFGKPLAAPSANPSGRISPTAARHVAEDFADTDLLVLDGGPATIGVESTIVKCVRGDVILLRPGGIDAEEIRRATGIAPRPPASSGRIESPGMLESHYAPRAALHLKTLVSPAEARLLAFGPAVHRDRSRASHVLNLSPTGDLQEAAANLYGYLKALDAQGAATIHVEPVPETGIGVAINDRLRRAAAPRAKG